MKKTIALLTTFLLLFTNLTPIYARSGEDEKVEFFIPPIYSLSENNNFYNGVAIVNKRYMGKYALINSKGEYISDFIYDSVSNFYNGAAIASKNGKSALINTEGKNITDFIYDGGYAACKGPNSEFYVVHKDKLSGVIDKDGKTIIPFKYDSVQAIDTTDNSVCYIVGKDELYGVIDKDDKIIMPIEYDNITAVYTGYNPGVEVKRYHTGTNTYKEIIPALEHYNTFNEYSSRLPQYTYLVAENVGYKMLFDIKGKEVLNEKFRDISGTFNGFLVTNLKKNQGIVGLNGEYIVQPIYTDIKVYSDGYMIAEYNILFDKEGNEIFKLNGFESHKPTETSRGFVFNGAGLLKVYKKNQGDYGFQCGYINKKGEIVIDIKYDEIIDVSEHRSNGEFYYNGKNILNSKSGKISEKEYSEVKEFSEGLLAVYEDGVWGFINTKGEEVISPRFDDVGNFHCGFAFAKMNYKWGIVDKNGDFVVRPKYIGSKISNDRLLLVPYEGLFFSYSDEFFYEIELVKEDKDEYGQVKRESDSYLITSDGVTKIDESTKINENKYKYEYEESSTFSENIIPTSKNWREKIGEIGYVLSSSDYWATSEIDKAVSMNLVPEYLNKDYVKKITRNQMYDIIMKFILTKSKSSFDSLIKSKNIDLTKCKAKNESEKSMYVLKSLGIIDDNIKDEGYIERQEAAVLITNIAKYYNFEIGFNNRGNMIRDYLYVNDGAKNSVKFVVSNDLIKLSNYKGFRPLNYTSRQEAVLAVKRLFELLKDY